MLIDGLLTFFDGTGTTSGHEGNIDVSTARAAGTVTPIGQTVDLAPSDDPDERGESGRSLGRGIPLLANFVLNTECPIDATFELWTGAGLVEASEANVTNGTAGDLVTAGSVAPRQVASVSFADGDAAGVSRFIHLQDDALRYLQVRLAPHSGTSDDNLRVSSFISTERPTTVGIVNVPFVSHNSYSDYVPGQD